MRYQDDVRLWTRRFSPAFYAEMFGEMGVSDVVRLNEAEYDAGAFAAAGIRHHDLFFEDCTDPPGDVVAAFLRIADAAPGVVAVHCKAGLGRTGTLIALCMMRSHGFTAREAMGWLRLIEAVRSPSEPRAAQRSGARPRSRLGIRLGFRLGACMPSGADSPARSQAPASVRPILRVGMTGLWSPELVRCTLRACRRAALWRAPPLTAPRRAAAPHGDQAGRPARGRVCVCSGDGESVDAVARRA